MRLIFHCLTVSACLGPGLIEYGALGAGQTPPPPRLAVAWNGSDTGPGQLQAMDTTAPWAFTGAPLEISRGSVLRYASGQLYVIGRSDHTIAVVDPDSWTIVRSYALGKDHEPIDLALVTTNTAYVTSRTGTHLLRLDLVSGELQEALDLSSFADEDRIPDLVGMTVHAGRLFIQIRRFNEQGPLGFAPPAYLAVMNLATEQLIDLDTALPGTQAIQLAGTAPKLKMQIMPHTRRLFLSATGGSFDAGGIEMIDLDTLRSLGLVVREADGLTGADLGPFVFVSPDRGYLVYTTDLTISSHLQDFSLTNGVGMIPFYTAVDFLAPVLVYEPAGDLLFFPQSEFREPGVHVFEAGSGRKLTENPIPTSGAPTDMVLLTDPKFSGEPASLEVGLHAGLQITGTVGATYQIQYAEQSPSTNWMALTNVTLSVSPFFWADPSVVKDQPNRFYRATLLE